MKRTYYCPECGERMYDPEWNMISEVSNQTICDRCYDNEQELLREEVDAELSLYDTKED